MIFRGQIYSIYKSDHPSHTSPTYRPPLDCCGPRFPIPMAPAAMAPDGFKCCQLGSTKSRDKENMALGQGVECDQGQWPTQIMHKSDAAASPRAENKPTPGLPKTNKKSASLSLIRAVLTLIRACQSVDMRDDGKGGRWTMPSCGAAPP